MPPGACLAYLRNSTWICEDRNLTYLVNDSLAIGLTYHFTSFGVLLESSDNNAAEGGDGFDNVLLIPIIVSVVAAVVFAGVVIVVLVAFLYWRRKSVRQKINQRLSSVYESDSLFVKESN